MRIHQNQTGPANRSLWLGPWCLSFFLVTAAFSSVQAKTNKPTSQPTKSKQTAKATKKVTKKKVTKKKSKKQSGKKKFKLNRWLSLGPASALLPSFHKEKQGKYTYTHFLKKQHLQISRLWPKKGKKHDWFLGQKLTWNKFAGSFTKPSKKAAVAYLATYLEADRYLKLKLKLRSHQRLRVFLDGRIITTKYGCTKRTRQARKSKKRSAKSAQKSKSAQKTKRTAKSKAVAKASQAATKLGPIARQKLLFKLTDLLSKQTDIINRQSKTIAAQNKQMAHIRSNKKAPTIRKKRPGLVRATLRLTPGVHLLIVKTLYTPDCVRRWNIKSSLHATKKTRIPTTFQATRKPYERHSIDFLFHRKRIGGLSLSPSGKLVVVRMYQWTHKNQWNQWIELRQTKDGKLINSSRPYARLRALQWSPDGKYYSFISRNRRKKTSVIWIVDSLTGKQRMLISGVKKLRWHIWAPNSRFLVYSTTRREKATANEKAGAKRLRGMNDRWPWYRHRSLLHAITLKSGNSLQITAGEWNIESPSIRPDSKRLLFARSRPDYKARPFSRTDLYELNFQTMKVKKILSNLRWFNSMQYSPDGKKILILGGPSLFGYLGRSPSLPSGVIANNYEGQAYVYDLQTLRLTALTKTFKPHVTSAYWHPIDGNIYLRGLDQTRFKLFQYNPQTQVFTNIRTDVDIARTIRFSRNSSHIVYTGQSVSHPDRLYTLDLFQPRPRLLLAPNHKWFSRLKLGTVKDWVTYSKKGVRIQGRVYLPPDFDPRKKYPAIVYYYGGTFPTTRRFDGSYSGHLWASHGYVTYILQPSGAIGFGQKFAARHVNEWGSIVADEIIDATKQFLKAHPFVDKKRVGCTGASYGGFMTMSIVTKTDLFAAAISHAGISNIASYWGAGYWGFLYSSIATAGKYPWSHPRFYVKQSPLFFAHKVKTPLLLIHGTRDNNVPPGESYQMYTALRLLQKKVELVLFKNEGHGIRSSRKRKIWVQTIIAWFEKQLKNRPVWWNKMYGTKQH